MLFHPLRALLSTSCVISFCLTGCGGSPAVPVAPVPPTPNIPSIPQVAVPGAPATATIPEVPKLATPLDPRLNGSVSSIVDSSNKSAGIDLHLPKDLFFANAAQSYESVPIDPRTELGRVRTMGSTFQELFAFDSIAATYVCKWNHPEQGVPFEISMCFAQLGGKYAEQSFQATNPGSNGESTLEKKIAASLGTAEQSLLDTPQGTWTRWVTKQQGKFIRDGKIANSEIVFVAYYRPANGRGVLIGAWSAASVAEKIQLLELTDACIRSAKLRDLK